jgi:hypothetical protein
MKGTRLSTLAAAAALLAAISAGPLDAQGKGNGNGKGNGGQHAGQAHGGGSGSKARAPGGGSAPRAARPATTTRASGSGRSGTATARSTTTRTRTTTARKTTARSSSGTRTAPAVQWDRTYDRRADRAWSWGDERYRLSTRRHRDVPPGWCNGVGNPHNTVANCGWSRSRYDAGGGVYRDDDGTWRDGDTRYGSYSEAHDAFHRHQDALCRDRADDRPFDPAYQLQVSRECSAEHDRWHDRYDPNADPSLIRVRLPI